MVVLVLSMFRSHMQTVARWRNASGTWSSKSSRSLPCPISMLPITVFRLLVPLTTWIFRGVIAVISERSSIPTATSSGQAHSLHLSTPTDTQARHPAPASLSTMSTTPLMQRDMLRSSSSEERLSLSMSTSASSYLTSRPLLRPRGHRPEIGTKMVACALPTTLFLPGAKSKMMKGGTQLCTSHTSSYLNDSRFLACLLQTRPTLCLKCLLISISFRSISSMVHSTLCHGNPRTCLRCRCTHRNMGPCLTNRMAMTTIE